MGSFWQQCPQLDIAPNTLERVQQTIWLRDFALTSCYTADAGDLDVTDATAKQL